MQLDRELIDVAGDFSALRLIFRELAADFVGVSKCVRARFFRLWNGCKFTALLAGQCHPCGRAIRYQRSFAMLAMKENVRIGCDLAERTFRRFHDKRTSRRYAQRANIQTQAPTSKETPNLNHQGSVRAIWNLELGISLAIGILAVGDSASRWLSSCVIIWLNCDWLDHFDAVAIEPKSSLTAD